MTGRHVVRVPNHLGDLVMALPAIRTAGGADLLAVRWLAPLLGVVREGDAEVGEPSRLGEVIPFDRGARGMLHAAARLRGRRYRHGVLLTPSLSSALLFTAAGVRERRGSATDRRRALLTDPVDPRIFKVAHRSSAYCALVTGELPQTPPVPRVHVPARQAERWSELAGAGRRSRVGIFPGSNAPSRRWDPDRFAEVARRLAGQGLEVVVFGGPGDRALTGRVAGGWARDFGGRTDLGLLSAGLASCAMVLSNDSGPLHLAAAVGTPTLSLWGAGNPASTGVVGEAHRMLRRPELPCVPCVRNECPRSGRGYVLAEADRECMCIITVDEVNEAARAHLARSLTPARNEPCPQTSAGS